MRKRVTARSFGSFIPAPESFIGQPGVETFEEAMGVYHGKLLKKWQWLIEGRPSNDGARPVWDALNERMALPLAQMFENQCILASGISHFEDTSLSTVTLPVRYSLPIIRQAYASVVVAQVAAYQPLSPYSGGTGNVFFMSFTRVTGGTSLRDLDSTYAMTDESAVPKRIKMTLSKETVTAEKRMLNAVWSTEVAEDLRGALGLDVGSELAFQASGEIAREIDYYAISKMLEKATAGNTNWDSSVASGYKAYEWYRTLGHAVVDAGDAIYGNVYRRPDWVIGGTSFVSYMRKAEEYVIEPTGDGPEKFLSGVERVGVVNKKWTLYESPMMPAAMALVSYYPRSNLDTPFILVPYIPLAAMPLVYGGVNTSTGAFENTDEWNRNMRTRSTEKVATPSAIATITVT